MNHTFHALTLGSGASTNLTAFSFDVEAFALFGSSAVAAALAVSVEGKFDLLEV